jgi:hypothetical protein
MEVMLVRVMVIILGLGSCVCVPLVVYLHSDISVPNKHVTVFQWWRITKRMDKTDCHIISTVQFMDNPLIY